MHSTTRTDQAAALKGAVAALEQLEALAAAAVAARESSLANVVPELERLEQALAEERMEQAASLHALAADERLRRLARLAREQRHEFDAIDLIGHFRFGSGQEIWASEAFHSKALAWLLDPNESHGVGDCFLQHFLRRAGVPESIRSVDWATAEVKREWGHEVNGKGGRLDLLVVNEAQRVLCAIENKTFSEEHDEQLTRYRKALDTELPTFSRHFVFLTPRGTKPFDVEEQAHWTPLTYSTVFEIIQSIAENNDEPLNTDVRSFLRQYATTLRRNLVPDTSVSQLARRIYLEHREAMELLIEHQPNWVEETKTMLKEAIARRPELILAWEDNQKVGFRPADWDQLGLQNPIPLGCSFRLYSDRPYFRIVLHPSGEAPSGLREKLFEAARNHPGLFKPGAASLDESWMLLHEGDYILEKSDHGPEWDDGTTRAKLEAWVADFATTRFPAMNKVIVDCLREYEAKERS